MFGWLTRGSRMKLVKELFKTGKLDEALQQLNELVEQHPHDGDIAIPVIAEPGDQGRMEMVPLRGSPANR